MEILSLLVLWLHVIAAVVWIGGNLILALVIVPYFKKSLPPVQRIQILGEIGKRFEPVVWGCVGVLFFTGMINIFTTGVLTSPELIGAFMRTLFIKLMLFIVLVILTALHGFVLGPKMSAAIAELDINLAELPSEVQRLRSQMSIVSSLMGVVSLLILLAAVALRMGI